MGYVIQFDYFCYKILLAHGNRNRFSGVWSSSRDDCRILNIVELKTKTSF